MSTDYTYDGEVRLFLNEVRSRLIDLKTGPVLPLFHLDHLRPRHPPPHLLSPKAQQRSVGYASRA